MNFRQNKNFLTNIVIYLTFFLLGVIITFKFIEYKNQIELSKTSNIVKNSEETLLNLDKYFKVYNNLKNKYYGFDEVDTNKLIESSISGLVKGLGDPYTEYFNVQENKDFTESLTGNFEGIGAVLEKAEVGVKIISVIENSPAENADIKPSDIIIEVNGTDISDMSTSEVVALIKGPAGKEVNLSIIRKEEIIKKQVFTGAITIPSIKEKNIDEKIGYIKISTFGEHTADEFKKSLNNFKDKKGIIIDLRDNGGGYLEIAVKILSQFIKKGEIVSVSKYENGRVEKNFSENDGQIFEGKIVVLINENSASASEIVAGALKDYQKAILVGEKTFGKGSVQEPVYFSDGSMVKITVAKWFTPKDINIDKEGINPDIEVKLLDKDFENKYDRQLEEAKKVLSFFINSTSLQLSIDNYKASLTE